MPKKPYRAMGTEITPSIIRSHLQPAMPCRPFMLVYKPAFRYPLNIPAIGSISSKIATLLVSSLGPQQPPSSAM